MGFAADVLAQVQRANTDLDEIIEQSVLEVGDRLIELSPEKTGQFKSNWNYGLGAPNLAISSRTDGREVNGLAAMPAEAAGAFHYISNSLPYALRLEYGFSGPDALGRVYNQPPRPMIGLVRVEWPQIVDFAARRVRG